MKINFEFESEEERTHALELLASAYGYIGDDLNKVEELVRETFHIQFSRILGRGEKRQGPKRGNRVEA